MSKSDRASQPTGANRRQFLMTSSALAVGGMLATGMAAPAVHAGGDDILKIGLIGCGGRGSGAAVDALSADPRTKLVAMGDLFPDRLESSHANLLKVKDLSERVDVPVERRFSGFDAYQKVIDTDVDVVLLCTPPHFRPLQLKAAIAANKHVFAEKPIAVDAPGVRSVLESCALAKEKNRAVVSGLCWRYDAGVKATVEKIQQGAIGDVLTIQSHYLTGGLWKRDRQPEWSDMEFQLRNWLYYTWLSGDHNVEQHVHSLDKAAWVMGDQYPVRAVGSGGRAQRTDPVYGHIFDHHAVVYEFANGSTCYAHTRQQDGCYADVSDLIVGTKGTANLLKNTIQSAEEWKYRQERGARVSMYKAEHEALFASIRSGNPINNGDYMCKSSLMAIMGRMATYTGKAITWDMALNSQEDLSPPAYDWIALPTPAVAVPGRTAFV